MARVKGPAKGALVIRNTDTGEFILVPLEPIELDDTQFGNVESGSAKIKIQAVKEDGHLRFEFHELA